MTSQVDFPSFPWYALKVKTRSESMAASGLKIRGYDPFCPVYSERRRYSDRTTVVETALFPGYLFCQFDLQRKLPIISSTAVQYIVAVDGVPATIGENLIASIRRAVDAGARPVPYLKVGQRVRVQSGPFTGIEGAFTSEAAKGMLTLSVDVLQGSVALHIDKEMVCPV